jgi:hypothetical protein
MAGAVDPAAGETARRARPAPGSADSRGNGASGASIIEPPQGRRTCAGREPTRFRRSERRSREALPKQCDVRVIAGSTGTWRSRRSRVDWIASQLAPLPRAAPTRRTPARGVSRFPRYPTRRNRRRSWLTGRTIASWERRKPRSVAETMPSSRHCRFERNSAIASLQDRHANASQLAPLPRAAPTRRTPARGVTRFPRYPIRRNRKRLPLTPPARSFSSAESARSRLIAT